MKEYLHLHCTHTVLCSCVHLPELSLLPAGLHKLQAASASCFRPRAALTWASTNLWPINPLICATLNMWACSHTNTHVCTCSICKHRHKLILCGLCKNSFSSERPPLQQMCLLSVMYACPNSTRAPGPTRHTFVSYPVPIRVRVGEVRRGQARCGIVESSAEP